jgi:hypothetical protein
MGNELGTELRFAKFCYRNISYYTALDYIKALTPQGIIFHEKLMVAELVKKNCERFITVFTRA